MNLKVWDTFILRQLSFKLNEKIHLSLSFVYHLDVLYGILQRFKSSTHLNLQLMSLKSPRL